MAQVPKEPRSRGTPCKKSMHGDDVEMTVCESRAEERRMVLDVHLTSACR
jgi:hypothetical protein